MKAGSTFYDASAGTTVPLSGTLTTGVPFTVGSADFEAARHPIVDIAIAGDGINLSEQPGFGNGPYGGVFDIGLSTGQLSQVQVAVAPADTRFGAGIPGSSVTYAGTPWSPQTFALTNLYPFLIAGGSGFQTADRLTLNLAVVPEPATLAAVAGAAALLLGRRRRRAA